MALLLTIMRLNHRNLLLAQECLMEPEGLLWVEADLFLHLQANGVSSNVCGFCCYVVVEKCLDYEYCWLLLEFANELTVLLRVPGDKGI